MKRTCPNGYEHYPCDCDRTVALVISRTALWLGGVMVFVCGLYIGFILGIVVFL